MNTPHAAWTRLATWLVAAFTTFGLAGCAATSVLTFAYEQANEGECLSAGCAAVAVVRHALDKATEGDPAPCWRLNSVERALSGRCGPYVPGTLLTKDVTASGLPRCPLLLAARQPTLWPVLPELIEKGAQPESCDQPPLAVLAQADPCPNFSAASSASLDALRWLAEVDAREIHHDVVRMLSCPSARLAGLDHVIDNWQAQGQLPTRGLAFGVFGALHPTSLGSPLAQRLEAQGHRARAGLGAYQGELPSGFDLALRSADRDALDWWFARVPGLVNRVPPRQGNQMPWLPLARVLTPSYLAQPQQQREMVAYLLARGADPWRTLPHDPGTTVVAYAWQLNSPLVALLDPVPQKKPQAGAGVAGAMVAGPANSMP